MWQSANRLSLLIQRRSGTANPVLAIFKGFWGNEPGLCSLISINYFISIAAQTFWSCFLKGQTRFWTYANYRVSSVDLMWSPYPGNKKGARIGSRVIWGWELQLSRSPVWSIMSNFNYVLIRTSKLLYLTLEVAGSSSCSTSCMWSNASVLWLLHPQEMTAENFMNFKNPLPKGCYSAVPYVQTCIQLKCGGFISHFDPELFGLHDVTCKEPSRLVRAQTDACKSRAYPAVG